MHSINMSLIEMLVPEAKVKTKVFGRTNSSSIFRSTQRDAGVMHISGNAFRRFHWYFAPYNSYGSFVLNEPVTFN